MNFRQLLQYELWSKRTTRKILVGIGIVVAGLAVWVLAEFYWVSPGERRVGKEALAQIDVLQTLDRASDEEFDAGDKRAEENVDTAQQAVVTVRDKRVANALDAYRTEIETERPSVKRRRLMKQRQVLETESEHDSDEELDSLSKEATQFIRSVLHKALD
jgi:hypothetical protein